MGINIKPAAMRAQPKQVEHDFSKNILGLSLEDYLNNERTEIGVLANHILKAAGVTIHNVDGIHDEAQKAEMIAENDQRLLAWVSEQRLAQVYFTNSFSYRQGASNVWKSGVLPKNERRFNFAYTNKVGQMQAQSKTPDNTRFSPLLVFSQKGQKTNVIANLPLKDGFVANFNLAGAFRLGDDDNINKGSHLLIVGTVRVTNLEKRESAAVTVTFTYGDASQEKDVNSISYDKNIRNLMAFSMLEQTSLDAVTIAKKSFAIEDIVNNLFAENTEWKTLKKSESAYNANNFGVKLGRKAASEEASQEEYSEQDPAQI